MGYACRVEERQVQVEVGKEGLAVEGRVVSWLDMDDVVVEDHTVRLVLAGAPPLTLTHLARARDDFLADLRAARSPARRAAMLQGSTAPTDTFTFPAGEIHLFADAVVVELAVGPPTFVPLSLVERVDRDGYTITLALRGGVPPLTVGQLARRTDEFLADLDKARAALAVATATALADLEPALAGLVIPDGWGIDAAAAGRWWEPLRQAVAGQKRGEEVAVLAGLAGDRLRLGVKIGGERGGPLPFALAQVGDRVAVEGTDADARATFVFATDDVDRLNVALLLTSFRREAISLPEPELGRWAVAARTLEVVRWARAALVARVVHDESWSTKVTAALTT